ncbi:coth protein-domain-containing protein [Sporodiniella umbellata]|nr:coth protein-domain-containing protein [Sporodiniella umbellata]
MVYIDILTVLFICVAWTVQAQNDLIQYRVISSLNQTIYRGLAVVVDNTTYMLDPYKEHSVLHVTMAPIAQKGYYYTKIETESKNSVREPFMRLPVQEDTLHEFFNRSWNTHNNYRLPQVYPMLPIAHRVPSKLHRDNEIPTVHIVGDQTEFDRMHKDSFGNVTVKTVVNYMSLSDALQFEDVRVRISGRLSRTKKKLSYKLQLKEEDDLYGYRTIKLRAMARDPSYVREQVAYDVIQSAGLVTTGTSYVRVILNQQDLGLFGIIEHFENPWLANVFADADGDYQQGPLFSAIYRGSKNKSLKSDLTYYSDLSLYADGEYKIRQNAADVNTDGFGPLQTLAQMIDNAPTTGQDAVYTWKSFLDMDSVLRSLALEILLGNTDGYLTRMNNFHIYWVPETEKFMLIPVDMDMTLGKRLQNLSGMWSGNYQTWPNFQTRPLTKKILAISQFRQEFETIIQKLNEKIINPQYIFARIDSITEMIREDVIWDKGCQRLGNSNTKVPGFSNTDKTWPENPVVDPDTAFGDSINGTTIIQNEMSVKLWLKSIHQNTTDFYSLRARNAFV